MDEHPMKIRKLKSYVSQTLERYTNYEFRRQRAKDWMPHGTIDIINLFLPLYGMNFPGASLLQIGAYDGEQPTAVWEWVQSSDGKTVLVEPIKRAFERLMRKYHGFSNVGLCNAAVARHDGQAKMYAARDFDNMIDIRGQWSSFSREHLLRLGLKEDEVQEEIVEVLRLDTLIDRFGIDKIDVLVIDAERYDCEVVKMALEMEKTPDCIYFEYIHFPKRQVANQVFQGLDEHDYKWMHDRRNTLAVKSEVLKALYSHLPERGQVL